MFWKLEDIRQLNELANTIILRRTFNDLTLFNCHIPNDYPYEAFYTALYLALKGNQMPA